MNTIAQRDVEGWSCLARVRALSHPHSPWTTFTNDQPGAIVVFPRDSEPRVLAFALAADDRYALAVEVPNIGIEVEIQASMTFAFEPTSMFGRRFVNFGGTVVAGEDHAIEPNSITTHMMWV